MAPTPRLPKHAKACSALVEAIPTLGILVNNAGIFEPKSCFDILDLFEINVLAAVRLSRAYEPAMLSRNWVALSSSTQKSALNIPNEMIDDGFTQAGELAIARGLVQLTGGTGVTVNSVLPEQPHRGRGSVARENGGTSWASRLRRRRWLSSRKKVRQRSCSASLGVEEVANMVVYAAPKQMERVEGGIVQTMVRC